MKKFFHKLFRREYFWKDHESHDKKQYNELIPLWHIWQAFAILFLIFFLSSFLSLAFVQGINQVGLSLIGLIIQDACFFLIPLLIACIYYKQPLSILGFKRPTLKQIIRIGIPAGILFYLINVVVSIFVNLIFPDKIAQSQISINLLELAQNRFELILLIFFFCILAPIAEETYFRAFVYPPTKYKFGRLPALLFNAALFAFIHFNIWTFLPLFAGGLGFVWLYDRYRNIWLNICSHFIWNATVVCLYLIFR